MLIFFLGVVLDLLSYIFMGLDAGVIAAAVNMVLGGGIVYFMVQIAKDQGREAEMRQQAGEMRQQAVQNARLGRKGLQQRREMTQNLLGNRASKRIFKRGLIMWIGSSIPIINFIPFWTIGTIMLLRGGSQSEPAEQTQAQEASSAGVAPPPVGWRQRLSGLVTPPARGERPETEPEEEGEARPEPAREERGLGVGQTARQPKISPTAARFAARTTEPTEVPSIPPPPVGGIAPRPVTQPPAGWTERPNGLTTPPVSGPRQTGEARRSPQRDATKTESFQGPKGIPIKPEQAVTPPAAAQQAQATPTAPRPAAVSPPTAPQAEQETTTTKDQNLAVAWEQEFGLVFDPEAELTEIRKLPREQRREAVRSFKRNLATQREGFMTLQEQLVQTVRENPNRSADELYQLVETAAPQHRLPESRKKLARGVLEQYEEKHKLVQGLRNQYPDDDILFEKLFGRRPEGKVEIRTNPSSFFVKIYDDDDYIYAHTGEGLGTRTPQDLAVLREDAKGAGGVSLIETVIPELGGSLTIEKSKSKRITEAASEREAEERSKAVEAHEEQHSLYDLRRQFVGPEIHKKLNEQLYSDWTKFSAAQRWRVASRERVENEFGKLAQSHRTKAVESAGNEVLAYFRMGESEATTTEILRDSPLYDYLQAQKEFFLKRSPSLRISRKEWNNIVQEELNEKYKNQVAKITVIPYELERQGYSKEQVLALLEQEPVSRWAKVATRLIKEGMSEKQ